MKTHDHIFNAKEHVRILLENEPATRNSDALLYARVCERINPASKNNFIEAFVHREIYGLPAFETVRRTRQYMQAQRPELGPTGRIKAARKENEVVYSEMFKKNLSEAIN